MISSTTISSRQEHEMRLYNQLSQGARDCHLGQGRDLLGEITQKEASLKEQFQHESKTPEHFSVMPSHMVDA